MRISQSALDSRKLSIRSLMLHFMLRSMITNEDAMFEDSALCFNGVILRMNWKWASGKDFCRIQIRDTPE